jgi:hypothetical protein
MDCQPIKQPSLCAVYCGVAAQGTFGRVPAKLFELFLIIVYD